jgi:hypothetical protein
MQVSLTTGPFSGTLQKGEAEIRAESGRVTRVDLTDSPTVLDIAAGRYSLQRVFFWLTPTAKNDPDTRWQYEFLRYPYGNKPAFPIQIPEERSGKTTTLNLLPKAEFVLYVGGGRRAGEALYPRVTVQTDWGLTLARMIAPPTHTEARAEIILLDPTPKKIDSDIARFT